MDRTAVQNLKNRVELLRQKVEPDIKASDIDSRSALGTKFFVTRADNGHWQPYGGPEGRSAAVLHRPFLDLARDAAAAALGSESSPDECFDLIATRLPALCRLADVTASSETSGRCSTDYVCVIEDPFGALVALLNLLQDETATALTMDEIDTAVGRGGDPPAVLRPPQSTIQYAEYLSAHEEGERARGYIFEEYPMLLYRNRDLDDARLVTSKDEHEALEAAEPGLWKDTYDPKRRDVDGAGGDTGGPISREIPNETHAAPMSSQLKNVPSVQSDVVGSKSHSTTTRAGWLADRLQRKHLSLMQLSELSGVDRTAIYDWRSGKTKAMTAASQAAIGEVLDVPASQFPD
jgi:hypothetical protein